MDDTFKNLYETELAHLKTHAEEFAADHRFGRLAGRVGLNPNAVLRDPFVDWMLQGYAFLAARVQEKLGEEFPRFTQNLLSVVNPRLTGPMPSLIVAGFKMRADPSLMSGPRLKRGHQLTLPTQVGGRGGRRNVIYTTGRDLRLWPIEMRDLTYLPDQASVAAAGASRGAPAGITASLTLTPEVALQDFTADFLDLHVADGEGGGAALFEALVLSNAHAEVASTVRRRGVSADPIPVRIAPLGFDLGGGSKTGGGEIDALLPQDSRCFDGFRLLQEFFALPSRFHFFRVSGLQKAFAGKSEQDFRLTFLLDRPYPHLAGKVRRDHLRPNCVPAINLFEHIADDIQMSNRRIEHHILPDRGDPTGYEVHSVASVTGKTKSGTDQVFRPFFSVEGMGSERGASQFYAVNRVAREVPAQREERDRALDEYRGTEMFLSLVDEAAKPVSPDLRALSLNLLCTNRHLPLYALGVRGADARLRSGSDDGWEEISIVSGPSAPRPGLPAGRRLWDAISHMSLNYLSLVETERGAAIPALRQIMALYAPQGQPQADRMINALKDISADQIVKRITPSHKPRGGGVTPVTFARGLEVTLALSDDPPEATTLAAILDRFFAGYVAANSFTRTRICRPDGVERLKWAPRSGSRSLL